MTKKPKTDRQLADEIVKALSKDTPENAGMEARSLLQRARDAGGGALRGEYLAEAQRAIARLDPARHSSLVQELQAQVLALQGRRGDTKVAHVTPGEIVIPRSLQTPELMQRLAEAAEAQGLDLASLQVGSGRNSINPKTGQPEFADSVLAPPQGPMETIDVTGKRPFSPANIYDAARILHAEVGNQPFDVKQKALQTMLSRVGTVDNRQQTLNDVMFAPDKYGRHQYQGVDNARFVTPVHEMEPKDAQSWEESLKIATDGINDAIQNGVDYGDRFFIDKKRPGASPQEPHDVLFSDTNPDYKNDPSKLPYPKLKR